MKGFWKSKATSYLQSSLTTAPVHCPDRRGIRDTETFIQKWVLGPPWWPSGLSRCALNAGGLGSVPGPGTRSHTLQLKYPLSSQISNNTNKFEVSLL